MGQLALALLFFCLVDPARAAYLSEIDLGGPGGPGGPGGQAFELSGMLPGSAYTVVVIDASADLPVQFGRVLNYVQVPAGAGGADGVLMLSESAWPGSPGLTMPLNALAPPPPVSSLSLDFSRLVVVLEGQVGLTLFGQLINDPPQPTNYVASDVTDWLVLGSGDLSAGYQTNGHDIPLINSTLGIDLLARQADTDRGSIIGRTHLPGQAIDLDTLYVGEPVTGSNQFLVEQGGYRYTSTPGIAGLALAVVPLPGDTDTDGDVDDADLASAFANYTGAVGVSGGKSYVQGETDADNDVDDADLSTIFSNYTGALGPSTLSVPEPASLVLLLLGWAGFGGRRIGRDVFEPPAAELAAPRCSTLRAGL